MVPANIAALNPRTIYAKKTIDGRGAPREVDDLTKPTGYMTNNGDGTYSSYTLDGALEDTFAAPGGFFSELSRNLNAIGDDRSGVGKFAATAAAMGYGASLVNGASTGAIAGAEGAAAAEAGGAGGGSTFSLQGGSGTLGAGSQASTANAMATGGTGLTVPTATTGATFGASSAAATNAALGGTTLASSLTPGVGGWSLAKTATTLNGAAKIAKDPKGALTDMALDFIPGGKDIRDLAATVTAIKVLTGNDKGGGGGGGTTPTTNTTTGTTDTSTGNVIDRMASSPRYDAAGIGKAIRDGVKRKWETSV